MTVTVKDEAAGTEIHLGESEIQPGATNAVIFAKTFEAVQSVIFDLEEQYNRMTFTLPHMINSERWGAMGRVWND